MEEECGRCKFPVMISFHNLAGSSNSFKLIQVEKSATFESVLEGECPEGWEEATENIKVKVSAARSGSFDKFGLNNTVGLVSRILKTDVIWVIFEKFSTPIVFPTRNAFDVLKSAASSKGLPEQISNPCN